MKNRERMVWSGVSSVLVRIAFLVLVSLAVSSAQFTFAQSAREQVDGVKNFGRVTDRYWRGGAATPAGITSLAALGARTIIDLRDNPNVDEPANSQRQGIKYFSFPMTGHDTPSDKAVSEILSIIRNAKEPVFVHCSAGKHRAGTIAALYRIRVQGWSKEQAWAEQQSYGFGSSDGHPQLYAYVYGKSSATAASNADVGRFISPSMAADNDEKSSKKKKKKDDDNDDSSKDKKKKKKDDDNDAAESKDRRAELKREPSAERAPSVALSSTQTESRAKVEAANATPASLSATADYLTPADAIRHAREAGGQGDLLKLDLEWDAVRSVATWDVTFSSGTEYELEAASGKLLGTKNKLPAKLATLTPLTLDDPTKRLLTFQEILRKAEASRGQSVTEIELKQIKGRSETVFEVVLADGTTLNYDAITGNVILA